MPPEPCGALGLYTEKRAVRCSPFFRLVLGKRAARTLDDMPRLDHAAHAGERIDLRIPADDRAGIEHAVAADLRKVAETILLGQRTLGIIRFNVIFALTIKAFFLILAFS